jgi:hypothetical protein
LGQGDPGGMQASSSCAPEEQRQQQQQGRLLVERVSKSPDSRLFLVQNGPSIKGYTTYLVGARAWFGTQSHQDSHSLTL